MRTHLVAGGALLALAAPAVAHAQAPLEQAKALVQRATIEYEVGHFQQALDLYGKAYELLPRPELLFDLGQCHRMLKDHERAVFFFQGYLREKPDAPNRALVEKLLAESQEQLAAQRRADAGRAETERAEADRRAAEQAAATQAPSVGPAPLQPPLPREPPPPAAERPVLRVAGLASAGAGIVLVGTAAYLGLHAASLSSEVARVSSQHGTWNSAYQSDYRSGRTDAGAATVLYVVGGAAIAAGAVLTYLGWPRRSAETRPVAAIAPADHGAAFVVVSSF
ncbi:MAG TPA: hypothetical protein VGG39_15120 [Polyangiaceae bacterium]|jgi:tetratricopeptide (TPR) repeat protein